MSQSGSDPIIPSMKNSLDLSSKSSIYQQMHFISVLENIKIYMNMYIETTTTCFGLRPSSGS